MRHLLLGIVVAVTLLTSASYCQEEDEARDVIVGGPESSTFPKYPADCLDMPRVDQMEYGKHKLGEEGALHNYCSSRCCCS